MVFFYQLFIAFIGFYIIIAMDFIIIKDFVMQEISNTYDLYNMDLSNEREVSLRLPNYDGNNDVLNFATIAPNAEKIALWIHGSMDGKNINFGPKVQYFSIEAILYGEILRLSGKWNFAEKMPNAKQICLSGFDMTNVTYLEFGQNVQHVSMRKCMGFFYISNFDIGTANIKSIDFKKIAPNATEIDLSNSNFAGITGLNFGPNVKKIDLKNADFTDMDFAENAPNAKEIDLRGVHLHGAVRGITANTHTKLLLNNSGNPDLSLAIENGILKMYAQRQRY